MSETKPLGGRPRKLDRAAAVAQAMSLFRRNGYEAVGVAQLCNALEVKPPSLYAAFGSKAGLFAAALDLYEQSAAAAFAPAFEESTPDGFVARLLACAAEFYAANEDEPGCLVLDGARNAADAAAAAETAKRRAASVAAIADHLKRCGGTEPKAVADACMIAMIGLSGAARGGATADALLDAARRFAAGSASRGGARSQGAASRPI